MADGPRWYHYFTDEFPEGAHVPAPDTEMADSWWNGISFTRGFEDAAFLLLKYYVIARIAPKVVNTMLSLGRDYMAPKSKKYAKYVTYDEYYDAEDGGDIYEQSSRSRSASSRSRSASSRSGSASSRHESKKSPSAKPPSHTIKSHHHSTATHAHLAASKPALQTSK